MRTVQFPEQLQELIRWLEDGRDEAFRPEREDHRWKEWWCLSQLVQNVCGTHQLAGEFSATWLDDHDKADFDLDMPSGRRCLEVTEATIPEERRTIAKARHDTATVRRPTVGRFTEGASGDAPERAVVDDVTRAISKKARKPYAQSAWILVYPNSDAVPLSPEPGVVVSILNRRLLSTVFDRVFVLLGRGSLIEMFSDGTATGHTGEGHG